MLLSDELENAAIALQQNITQHRRDSGGSFAPLTGPPKIQDFTFTAFDHQAILEKSLDLSLFFLGLVRRNCRESSPGV